MHIRARALSVCSVLLAVLFLVSPAGVSAQDKKDQKNQPKFSKDQVQEAQRPGDRGRQHHGGEAARPDRDPVSFYHHFMRSREGKTFIPYTLAIDQAAADVRLDAALRAGGQEGRRAPAAAAVPADPKDKDKKAAPQARPEYAWEEYYFIDVKTATPAPAAGQPYRRQPLHRRASRRIRRVLRGARAVGHAGQEGQERAAAEDDGPEAEPHRAGLQRRRSP